MPVRNLYCQKYLKCLDRAAKRDLKMACELGECDPSKIMFDEVPNKKEVIEMAQKEKRCSKCGNLKFIDQFSKNASTGDGLERWCKDCKKKQGADYRDRKKKSGNGRKRRMASKPRSLPGLSPKIDDAIFLDQETIAGLQRAVAKKIINVIEKAFL